ncbi:MAG: hypothetical protein P8Z40_09850 [Chloroflexota bacterium]
MHRPPEGARPGLVRRRRAGTRRARRTRAPRLLREADPTVLAETAAAGGFTINLNILPSAQYWDIWTEVDLGITIWAHRPLGTMVPALAYTADEDGNPGAWNEMRWVDEEFVSLLREAERTLDVEARRAIMCDLEQVQMDRGPVGIAFFTNVWYIAAERFKNIRAHPTNYDHLDNVWEDV